MKTRPKLLFGKRVIVIEDDEVDQMLLKFMVEGQGAEFVLEADEHKALQRLKEEHFDLVLLDTRLENTNIINFTREVRTSSKHKLSIVGVSSVDMQGRGIHNGLDEVLIRPIEYGKFQKIIHKLLNK